MTKALEESAKLTAAEISARLSAAFGDIAQGQKAQEVIAQEVDTYIRLGRKTISLNDLVCLEKRARDVLQGARPTRAFKVMCKKALAEADEWTRLSAFQDSLKDQEDKARRAVQAQKQKELQHQLEEQVLEVEQRHKYEVAQDLVAARALEEDACKWREAQAEKQAQKKIVMLQLKASVEEQLAQRDAKKRLEKALKLQEEQGDLLDMAAELRASVEADAREAAAAQKELHQMLLANEAHKELKTKQRLEDQALDRKYAREYAEKLDKEEKARVEQLAKTAEYQAQQAVIAKQLPESKRWIDPAIIERGFKAREEAEEKRDIERKQAAESAKIALRAQLAEQVAERRAAEDKQKVIIARGEQALESMHQREVALEVQEREKLLLKKEALRRQLEMQLEEALARKLRAEPAMTQTEREINADMLRRMYAAEIATASQPGTI